MALRAVLVSILFPQFVAGAEREQASLRAGLKARRAEQPAVMPCADYGTSLQNLNPCKPDFTGIEPDKKVTKEDIQKANMQRFIDEVVMDEDQRVAAAASSNAKEIFRIEKVREDAAADVQKTADAASAAVEAAKVKASYELNNATAAMIKDVAMKAALLGQREQLAKDQELISRLLTRMADRSMDAAALAEAKAVQDQMKADAANKVAASLEKTKDQLPDGSILDKDVAKALKAAADQREDAANKSQRAIQGTADFVAMQSQLLRGIKTVASTSIDTYAKSERQFDNAYDAPIDYVDAMNDGIGAKDMVNPYKPVQKVDVNQPLPSVVTPVQPGGIVPPTK